MAAIFQRKQLPSENVQDFISNLQHEGNLVKLPEEQIKQAILNGLSPDIRPFILQSDPQTIEEIQENARLLDGSTTKAKEQNSIISVLDEMQRQMAALTATVNTIGARNSAPEPRDSSGEGAHTKGTPRTHNGGRAHNKQACNRHRGGGAQASQDPNDKGASHQLPE